MLPIVGGSATGSRLGSGRDLPFSYGEHYDDGDDEGDVDEDEGEEGE